MASRRQFNGIANDLSTFIHSRNFDIDGYWGVAFLCVKAKAAQSSKAQISLSFDTGHDVIDETAAKKNLRKLIHGQMQSQEMPPRWLKHVEIVFEFGTVFDPILNHPSHALAPPFQLDVVITSDLGRSFRRTTAGICWEQLYFSCRRIKSQRNKWG